MMLRGYALNQLYPYLAARVNETLTNGGFPPVMLTPVDFLAVMQQQQQKKAEAEKAANTVQ